MSANRDILELRVWLRANPRRYIGYVFYDQGEEFHWFPAQKYEEFKETWGDIFSHYTIHTLVGKGGKHRGS